MLETTEADNFGANVSAQLLCGSAADAIMEPGFGEPEFDSSTR